MTESAKEANLLENDADGGGDLAFTFSDELFNLKLLPEPDNCENNRDFLTENQSSSPPKENNEPPSNETEQPAIVIKKEKNENGLDSEANASETSDGNKSGSYKRMFVRKQVSDQSPVSNGRKKVTTPKKRKPVVRHSTKVRKVKTSDCFCCAEQTRPTNNESSKTTKQKKLQNNVTHHINRRGKCTARSQKNLGSTNDMEKSPEENNSRTSNKTANNEDEELSDTETVPLSEENSKPTQPLISVRRAEDLMINRAQVNGQNEECNVCFDKFSTAAALDQHRANAGHFTCSLSEDCINNVFSTAAELSQHQAMHHQPPVQQLAQQVQRIPASFTSPSYRAQTPPQQRSMYMSSPPMAGGTQQIGSGVVLSTVSSPSVPNLPPGIQLSKRSAPQHSDQGPSPKQRRDDHQESRPNIRLPDSITLVSRTPPQPTQQQRRNESVTDMLANRGITVVPSGRPNNSQPSPSTSALPRSLMNTSAISITPSSQQHSRQSNFAVPAPKQVSRLLTVDLTKESDTPPRRSLGRGGRMRGLSSGRSVCQICDKAFPTPQELSQHMACHRGGSTPNKLAFECRECTAQYPTEAGLQAHRQKYHGAGGPSPDMAIPVVDLKQVGVLSRLAALGIRSVIPLSQLHSGSGGGLFGLPVVAVDSASNPAICNIGGLGASNLLPLGPLKNLPFNNNMR